MASYLGRSAADSSVGPDGWFRTGDLGYLVDGELVVVGRAKDIVVVGGRNVVPDDVERAVGALAGIRPGRVAAVPVAGRAGEALGVVAERTDDAAGAAVDAAAVRAAVQRALALAPEVVTFVARGAMPKTTSGKLRRQACRGLLTAPERTAPPPS
jgi:acyl-CoA synthetase (AMP-forming)/AMP-acid ligase II